MKPFLTGLVAVALLAGAWGSGLWAQKRAPADPSAPVQIKDDSTLAQWLQQKGYKDARVINPGEQSSYVLFTLDSGGSKMSVKGWGNAKEPLINLFVELKVPPNVPSSSLLKVLTLTRGWMLYVGDLGRPGYRPGNNKIVLELTFNSNHIAYYEKSPAELPKTMGNFAQTAQQIYTYLNPAASIN